MSTPPPEMPWAKTAPMNGELAVLNLKNYIPLFLGEKRAGHIQTVLVAAGTLAGLAAQHAALVKGSEATQKFGYVPDREIMAAEGNDGELFFFGNWINENLLSDRRLGLYKLAGGIAHRAGTHQRVITSVEEIVAHVAGSMGTRDFGTVRTPPVHAPQFQPREIARKLWEGALPILRMRSMPGSEVEHHPIDVEHWPTVACLAATHLLKDTTSSLDPAVGYTLVMESAIIASKISPYHYMPGKWNFRAKSGHLAIDMLKA